MRKEKQKKEASPDIEHKERRDKESGSLQIAFTQYENSIAAIREFFSSICPVVTEIDKGMIEKQEAYLKNLLDDFRSKATKEEFEEFGNFWRFMSDGAPRKTGGKKKKDFSTESPLVTNSIVRLLKVVGGYHPEGVHHELLNRSILMSLVSYFEVLMAELAHGFYKIAPDAVANDDKVLSVRELKKFNSIDEALRFIVAGRVDRLLNGSVSEWREFLQSNVKADMKSVVPDWARWNEYFQRRHIVVHAGGHATELYLSRVDWKALEPRMNKPSRGDSLPIEDAYIEDAISDFEISGLLLCQEVWKRLISRDGSARYSGSLAGVGLLDVVYSRLLSKHWYAAEKIASWGEKDPEAPEDAMLTCKFNRWLCKKRQGLWQEVEDEVKSFDCSAKNRRFSLVRASLLEHTDDFYAILEKAFGDDVDIQALKEWPILDEMRSDSRFEKFVSEAETSQKSKV